MNTKHLKGNWLLITKTHQTQSKWIEYEIYELNTELQSCRMFGNTNS